MGPTSEGFWEGRGLARERTKDRKMGGVDRTPAVAVLPRLPPLWTSGPVCSNDTGQHAGAACMSLLGPCVKGSWITGPPT